MRRVAPARPGLLSNGVADRPPAPAPHDVTLTTRSSPAIPLHERGRRTVPCSFHEPADSAGTGRNEKGRGGIEAHEPLQPDASQIRVSQRVARIRCASLDSRRLHQTPRRSRRGTIFPTCLGVARRSVPCRKLVPRRVRDPRRDGFGARTSALAPRQGEFRRTGLERGHRPHLRFRSTITVPSHWTGQRHAASLHDRRRYPAGLTFEVRVGDAKCHPFRRGTRRVIESRRQFLGTAAAG